MVYFYIRCFRANISVCECDLEICFVLNEHKQNLFLCLTHKLCCAYYIQYNMSARDCISLSSYGANHIHNKQKILKIYLHVH